VRPFSSIGAISLIILLFIVVQYHCCYCCCYCCCGWSCCCCWKGQRLGPRWAIVADYGFSMLTRKSEWRLSLARDLIFFCGFFQFEIAELHTGRYLVIAGRWLLGRRPQYLSVDIVRSTCMRVILQTRAAAGSAWGAFAVHHLRVVVVGLGTSCFGHHSLS